MEAIGGGAEVIHIRGDVRGRHAGRDGYGSDFRWMQRPGTQRGTEGHRDAPGRAIRLIKGRRMAVWPQRLTWDVPGVSSEAGEQTYGHSDAPAPQLGQLGVLGAIKLQITSCCHAR